MWRWLNSFDVSWAVTLFALIWLGIVGIGCVLSIAMRFLRMGQ